MSDGRLMGEDRARSLLRVALEHSTAEQTEAALSSSKWALTRFANSAIHQNMGSENTVLRVRAVFGRKIASGTSNRVDAEGIRALVDDVVRMARLQDENPDFVSLPEPSEPASQAEAYHESTARSTPEDRARMVSELVGEAEKVNSTAAGSLITRANEHAVMNSLGIDTYYRGTATELVTVVTAPEGGFGYAAAESSNLADVDARAAGKEAAGLADASRSPAAIEPGDYEAILMPYAVADMVKSLVWMAFNAMAYQENRSFVCGKLGRKIADEVISIWDDALDPRTMVAPFDAEGVAKQRVDLIKGGVASGLLYSSYTAHREGKKSTGHASGLNLAMEPGTASVDEMIAGTRRGILVTRLHYTNTAHLMSASFTGMTRDGTFLVENGKVVGPVKNLRFTQGIPEALNGVEAIGSDLKLVDNVLVPALKLGKFRFSSATEF